MVREVNIYSIKGYWLWEVIKKLKGIWKLLVNIVKDKMNFFGIFGCEFGFFVLV